MAHYVCFENESDATPRFHGGDLKCCGAFKRCERPSCNYFCVGRRQVYRKDGRERAASNIARAAPQFESDCCFQIQAPGRPRRLAQAKQAKQSQSDNYTLAVDP